MMLQMIAEMERLILKADVQKDKTQVQSKKAKQQIGMTPRAAARKDVGTPRLKRSASAKSTAGSSSLPTPSILFSSTVIANAETGEGMGSRVAEEQEGVSVYSFPDSSMPVQPSEEIEEAEIASSPTNRSLSMTLQRTMSMPPKLLDVYQAVDKEAAGSGGVGGLRLSIGSPQGYHSPLQSMRSVSG
jgi:hypothetical protein